MPSSTHHQLTDIVDLVMKIDPKSILDVGVGFGKYGVLLREYLELWDGRNKYNDWQRRIDGIEVFRQYHNPIYDWAYDVVYFGNAAWVIQNELDRSYDLILMIDVLEHFDKNEGQRLLTACRGRSKQMIIATPKRFSNQGSVFDNPHETHQSCWTADDLVAFGVIGIVPNAKSTICSIEWGCQ